MSSLEKHLNPLTHFGFEKLYEAAEIAKFSRVEREAYENSLKYYRDINNVVDTAVETGVKKVAKNMKVKGMPYSVISEMTGLSHDEIDELR